MATAAKLQLVVVDDQLTIRTLVRTSLQQIGITNVREFAAAAEAWENIKVQPAHIIILLLTPTPKALTRVRTLAEIARIVNDAAVRAALVRAASVVDAMKVLESAAARARKNGDLCAG